MRTKITACAILLLYSTSDGFAQAPRPTTPTTPPVAMATVPATAVGGSVTINSTAYVVNAKKQLATGVEYYTMKPASAKAKAATFLRTGDTYRPTVFTQAQYETFLKTGKVSSFGKVQTMTVNGMTLRYVTSGTSTAFFATKRNGRDVNILEYVGNPQVLAVDNDDTGGGGMNPDQLVCRRGCLSSSDECHEEYGQDDEECTWGFLECLLFCEEIFPLKTRPGFMHKLVTTMTVAYK